MNVNKKKIIYENKWLNVISKEIQINKKKIIKKLYSINLHDYVNVMVQTSDQKFVLVKQYRHSIEKYSLEFPGGLLEKNEKPKICAIREVKEETGIEINYIIKLGTLSPDVGRLSNRVHMYFAKTKIHSKKIKKSNEQGITVLCKSKNEIKLLIKKNKIFHQPFIGLFYLGILNNLF